MSKFLKKFHDPKDDEKHENILKSLSDFLEIDPETTKELWDSLDEMSDSEDVFCDNKVNSLKDNSLD